MILLSHIVWNKNQWPLSLLSKWWPRNELSNTIENMKVHITNILYWHANLPVHNAAICANKRITCLIKWYCIKHVILLSLHPSLFSLSLSFSFSLVFYLLFFMRSLLVLPLFWLTLITTSINWGRMHQNIQGWCKRVRLY